MSEDPIIVTAVSNAEIIKDRAQEKLNEINLANEKLAHYRAQMNAEIQANKSNPFVFWIGLTTFVISFAHPILLITWFIIGMFYMMASMGKTNNVPYWKRNAKLQDEEVNRLNFELSLIRMDTSRVLLGVDKYINELRQNLSTRTENIVVGYSQNQIAGITTNTPNYATRTHEVSDHKIEQKVLSKPPSLYEIDIYQRGIEALPNLIARYRDVGANHAVTKRMLNKLPKHVVGQKFEEYEMLTEAEGWYSVNQLFEDAKRIRKLLNVKIDQTVIQGDQVTKTEIKDSVLNRSSVGSGSSKMQEIERLAEMKEKGLIDDDEFKQMKKEIFGK
ncbi:SHOCT domain-containing protein [Marine Group III euryarchaeote]|nr:SHOCT domain-containing protein [Marine Group III euryarchaeote]